MERLSPGPRPTQTRSQRLGAGAGERLSLSKAALVLSTSNQLFGLSLLKLRVYMHTPPTRASRQLRANSEALLSDPDQNIFHILF